MHLLPIFSQQEQFTAQLRERKRLSDLSDATPFVSVDDKEEEMEEEIDDDEVKSYMESMLANGALRNAPDFISFDPETGELD